jgi:tripartite-type tricarboxylate transporter receptor subunit TctC
VTEIVNAPQSWNCDFIFPPTIQATRVGQGGSNVLRPMIKRNNQMSALGISRRCVLVSAVPMLLVAVTVVWSSAASAQSYPSRPIKMIVPHSIGGTPHAMGQMVAEEASTILGQPIIVEARWSGGGMIGTKDVINSAPDGYSVLFADSTAYAVTPHLFRNTKFEPLKGIKAVAPIATIPLVLVVNPNLQVSTFNEFLALAKNKPDLLCGTSGNGTPHHLGMELLNTLAGIRLGCVPYRGSGQESVALITGEVSVGFLGLQSAVPLAEDRKLRMLAVSTSYRLPELPDVPTVAEVGVPAFELATMLGLFVPSGTPSEIVTKLYDAFSRATKSDVVRERRVNLGLGSAPNMSPDEYMDFARQEYAKYGELVRLTKAYVN